MLNTLLGWLFGWQSSFESGFYGEESSEFKIRDLKIEGETIRVVENHHGRNLDGSPYYEERAGTFYNLQSGQPFTPESHRSTWDKYQAELQRRR